MRWVGKVGWSEGGVGVKRQWRGGEGREWVVVKGVGRLV